MSENKSILYIIGVSIVLMCTGCVNVFKLVDLRDNAVDVEEQSSQKAKDLLSQMGEAHNISRWEDIGKYEVRYTDEFYTFIGKTSNPFKDNPAHLNLSYEANTFNGELTQIDTDNQETWGISDWKTYEVKDGVKKFKKHKKAEFWLPTYQYFIEFPKRIQEATSMEYIGQKVIKDINCDGVLASWDTTSPQKDIDQYIVWMDAETKRVVKVEYTVREMYKFLTGGAYFEKYQETNGLLIPRELPVESNLVKKGLLHKMTIEEISFSEK